MILELICGRWASLYMNYTLVKTHYSHQKKKNKKKQKQKGNFLFPGSTNNQMLKLMMQTKGKPNNRMIRRGEFSGKYFDPNY